LGGHILQTANASDTNYVARITPIAHVTRPAAPVTIWSSRAAVIVTASAKAR
jgi:hypothetical protein